MPLKTDVELVAAMLTALSPSSVGEAAACPYRLVQKALDPKPKDPRWQPYADFGTVCHWQTQFRLGCAPATKPAESVVWSACKLSGMPKTPAGLWQRADDCATTAIRAVQAITPLRPGVTWLGEQNEYTTELLPQRRGRKGELKGYGGSLDLLKSDRSYLIDLKFVGPDKVPETFASDPRSEPGDLGIKNEYIWQCASYHIVSKVPLTTLLWVSRDAKKSAYVEIDWTTPQAKQMAIRASRFIEFVGFSNFASIAWPVRGPHCAHCEEKPTCPAWCAIRAKDPAFRQALRTSIDPHMLGLVPAAAAPAPPAPVDPAIAAAASDLVAAMLDLPVEQKPLELLADSAVSPPMPPPLPAPPSLPYQVIF